MINKNFIFDLDGTLYEFDKGQSDKIFTSKFYEEIRNNAYGFLASELTLDFAQAQNIFRYIFEKYNGEVSLGLAKEYNIGRMKFFENTWDIEPDKYIKNKGNLAKILKLIKGKKIVLTQAPKIWADKVLDYLGITENFDLVVTGEPDLRKPDVRVFKNICKTFNLKPPDFISVGDQEHTDIIPAQNIGMTTIIIRANSQRADYQLGSIDELLDLLLTKKL